MTAESFAVYLTKHLIANHGFQPGHPPEAAALAADCDYLLTRMDGYALTLTAIIDGERTPNRIFTLTREQMIEIAGACQKYGGQVQGTKMPVVLQLIECGLMPVTAEQKQRLTTYRKRVGSVVHIQASAIDVNQREVYSPGRLTSLSSWGRDYRRLLRGPRVPFTAESFQPPALEMNRPPVATYGLMAIIIGIYIAGAVAFGSPVNGLSVPQLLDIGALNRQLVAEGEWWRLLTMMFLHGGLLHIFMNALVLYMAGNVLERMLGWAWFTTILVLSGIAGSAFSLAFNVADMTAVGASGAVMGVVAAAFACSYRLPHGHARSGVQMNMGQVLALSIVPIFFLSGQGIDFYSHIGGALMGGLLGWLAYAVWPRQQKRPSLQPVMHVLAGIGILLCVYGGLQVQQHLAQGSRFAASLAPDSAYEDASSFTNANKLIAQYPDDPRLYMMQGLVLLDAQEGREAEAMFRKALSFERVLQFNFKPQLRYDMQAMLVISLLMQLRETEARVMATPELCTGASEQYIGMLKRAELCN